MNATVRKFKASDLPVAIYLNQRIVFDLLAIAEGGLAQLERVETTTGSDSASKTSGSIGIGNPFALISLGLRGDRERAVAASQSQRVSEDVAHTPTSLFARLVDFLDTSGLIRDLDYGISELQNGDFVRFRATLGRSPALDKLVALKRFMPFAKLLPPSQGASRSSSSGQRSSSSVAETEKILDALLKDLASEGAVDLVGTVSDADQLQCLLTADAAFFVDPTLSNLLDGEFQVVGKVTKIVRGEGDDGIELFRKSSLSKVSREMLATVIDAINSISPDSEGARLDLPGPALQLIPIAISA